MIDRCSHSFTFRLLPQTDANPTHCFILQLYFVFVFSLLQTMDVLWSKHAPPLWRTLSSWSGSKIGRVHINGLRARLLPHRDRMLWPACNVRIGPNRTRHGARWGQSFTVQKKKVLIGSSDNLQSTAVSEQHAFRRSEQAVHTAVACRWCADVPGHSACCAQKVATETISQKSFQTTGI